MRELEKRWKELMRLNPSWRLGQSLFNAMLDVCPAYAEAIRGTHNDPFHNDTRCTTVLDWLSRRIPA